MKGRLLAAALAWGLSQGTGAHSIDGNQLAEWLAGKERYENSAPGSDPLSWFAYQYYVLGVFDAYSVSEKLTEQYSFCVPDGVTSNQLFDVVAKYLNGNPEHLHIPAGVLVYVSLQKAFPCPD
ncbi:MAG: Rap1a/Tai family immunity protein [Polycyclovorans sp.]|nr:Rap1a/Tai family immunity protein [Polycyclovorans sp.]